MQNLKKELFVGCMMIAFTMISCKNEDVSTPLEDPILAIDTSSLINYKGLYVNHRFETPLEVLETEHNQKNLKIIFKNLKQNTILKGVALFQTTSDDLPDAEIILEAAKDVFHLFPYEEIKEEDPYSGQELDSIQMVEIEQQFLFEQEQKDQLSLEMIQQDFPTLTDQEIEDNLEIIDEYYGQNLNYTVLSEIVNNQEDLQNRVAQRRSSKSFIETNELYNAVCILANFQTPLHFINPLPSFLPGGGFNYALSAIALVIASDQVRTTSNNFYTNIGGVEVGATNTIRDTYRHLTWSALLAQHYFAIASKHKRLQFSEAITYANEVCGNNDVDSRQMDYHNNDIGRKIWKDHTRYRKFLGIIVGLDKPSLSKIKRLARLKLDFHSCFLVKESEIDYFPENLINEDKTKEYIQAKIMETNAIIPVYFKGPIAASRYEWVEEATGYDYTPCYEGDYLNCPTITYEWVENEIVSCYRL